MPSATTRCRACGSPLADAGFFARLLPATRMCGRCRDRVARQKVVAADEQSDPFSFFLREEQLHEGHAGTEAAPVSSSRPRMLSHAAVPARTLILAFTLGLAGGAAPFWWQSVMRGTPASAEAAREEPGELAPAAKPTPVIATVLPPAAEPSSPVRMADISLPASSEPGSAATAGATPPPAPRRRAAPAITTIRYPARRPATFRGSLAVTTTPTGARVLINGTPLGSTPLQIEGVPAGSHVLRLEADGRRVSASAIQVVADRITRVTRALEPSP